MDTIMDAFEQYQKECDDLWDSFDVDTREKLFCAVIKKLHKGEIEDERSYRGVLYSVFGFDPGSYGVAQHAGYLELHNSIFRRKEIIELVKDFVTNHMDITNDNLEKQVKEFVGKKHYGT
jgi:hypothetical protein